MKNHNFSAKKIAETSPKQSYDFKKLGTKFSISLATFILGALLVMNISGVGATSSDHAEDPSDDEVEATISTTTPSERPPGGDVNATFNSVSTSLITNPNNTGTIAEKMLTFDDDVRVTKNLLVDTSLAVQGPYSILSGTTLTNQMGSHFNSIDKHAGLDTSYPKIGERYEVVATCPENSVIVNCSGYLWVNGSLNQIDFMGAETLDESCRSYARRNAAGGEKFWHYAEAVCFDPSVPNHIDLFEWQTDKEAADAAAAAEAENTQPPLNTNGLNFVPIYTDGVADLKIFDGPSLAGDGYAPWGNGGPDPITL